jgi:hypothetical protein
MLIDLDDSVTINLSNVVSIEVGEIMIGSGKYSLLFTSIGGVKKSYGNMSKKEALNLKDKIVAVFNSGHDQFVVDDYIDEQQDMFLQHTVPIIREGNC